MSEVQKQEQRQKQNPSDKGKALDSLARVDSNVALGSVAGRYRATHWCALILLDIGRSRHTRDDTLMSASEGAGAIRASIGGNCATTQNLH